MSITYLQAQFDKRVARRRIHPDKIPEYGALVPIRDLHQGGEVVFCLQFYGIQRKDLLVSPGGAAPIIRALERRGLDPNRYQATIWDI